MIAEWLAECGHEATTRLNGGEVEESVLPDLQDATLQWFTTFSDDFDILVHELELDA
jgi:hypothetical protein